MFISFFVNLKSFSDKEIYNNKRVVFKTFLFILLEELLFTLLFHIIIPAYTLSTDEHRPRLRIRGLEPQFPRAPSADLELHTCFPSPYIFLKSRTYLYITIISYYTILYLFTSVLYEYCAYS